MTTEVLSYTISAGTTVRAPRGRLFFVKTAANPLSITASGRPGAPIKFSNITAGLKYGPVDESEHWEYLEITSATTQTIEMIIGDDDVEVAGTVSVAGTVTTVDASLAMAGVTDTSVAATSSSNISVSPTRKLGIYSSLSTNVGSIRIGPAGTSATNGAELQPGQSISLPTNSNIFVYNPNASACVVTMLEFT